MNKKNPHIPDVCFGTTEQMLAWAKEENLDLVYDEDGDYDWEAVYEQYLDREEGKEKP